jgi:hypothetical protein
VATSGGITEDPEKLAELSRILKLLNFGEGISSNHFSATNQSLIWEGFNLQSF